MELYEVIEEKCCDINFHSTSKLEAIKKLATLAKKSPLLKNIPLEVVEQTLLKREQQGTTGFGEGIAIPHGKVEGMNGYLIFIAVSPKGVFFDSMDKKKVRIFVVLLGPDTKESRQVHLKLLSSVSTTIAKRVVRKEILNSPSVSACSESFIKNTNITTGKKEVSKAHKLMQIILYFEEYLYEILEVFIEEDIEGASVVDSFGMGEYISNIPLFADFIGFMQENKNKSKTITALIPENKVDRIVSRIEDIMGDLSKKQGAVILVQNIEFFKGSMKMM